MTLQISVDFYCHSNTSKDSSTSPESLVHARRYRGLNRLVVTVHNTISGAIAAQALDPEMIIKGEEIMTTRGEFLAILVADSIPPGLSPHETIERPHDQGAFISISHPFDTWRNGSWSIKDLLEIIPHVDALEVFNARCMAPKSNFRASQFAQKYSVTGTVGSDVHTAFELGVAYMDIPSFETADELRRVIHLGKVLGRQSPFWFHLFSRYASLRKNAV
jgi:predicted metal-dependent phosphoesterase TrpH